MFRQSLRSSKFNPSTNRRPARSSRARLMLQGLEDRTVPASFNVTSLADSGAGTLREAINFANDELTNPGLDTITFTANGTVNLLSGLTVTSDINFNGPGSAKLILDGGNANQIINILGNGTTAVSLSAMTLTKGKAIGFKGGAIGADSASLSLTNVVVTNSFSDLFGGGIFVNEGNLTITGSTITGNTVESDLNAIYGGGIAMLGSGTGNISNSTVSNNTAKSTTSTTLRGIGGGIYFGTTATPTHTLTNVIISGNTAKGGFGGGVYNLAANLVVDGCTVTSNKATPNGTLAQSGGGIESDGTGTLTVTNTTFTSNSADNTANSSLGGGMFIGTTGTITITNCAFNNGFASNAGGAFWMSDPGANTLISNCSFDANKGNGAGGATRIGTDAGGLVTFENCSFTNNISGNSGGVFAISTTAGVLNWNNCTFTGNTAAANGSVMRFFGTFDGTVNINNSTATGNTANNSGGGALSLSGTVGAATPTMNIVSSIVAENIAGGSAKNAGADLARAVGNMSVDFSLIGVFPVLTPVITEPTAGSNLKGNTTTPLSPNLLTIANYGGSTKTRVPAPGSPVIDKGSNPLGLVNDQRGPGFTRLFNGKADMGAVEANRPAPTVASVTAPDVVTAGGTSFTFVITFQDDNGIDVSTLSAAGAVTVSGGNYASPVTAVFKSVDINTNGTPRSATFEAPAPGGTIDLADNGVYTINVVGGKIFDIDTPTPISVNSVVAGTIRIALPQNFVVDEASDVDDGIFTAGKLSLREAIQLANTATGFDSVTFSPSVFASATTITLDNNRIPISDSTKLIGPAAELTLEGNPTVGEQSYHFNVDGIGTLNVEISNLRMINGNRNSNAFGANGGAVGNNDENLTITNCIFENNTSKLDGGAVGMSGKGVLTVNNSKFMGNFSQAAFGFSGGAIGVVNSGDLNVGNCTFTANIGDSIGGAIRAIGTNSLTITNSTFIDNESRGTGVIGGGAIAMSGVTKASITGSTFTGNKQTVDGFGGAISIFAGTTDFTIGNCTFTNNTAGGDGGAIVTRNDFTGTMTINNSTFTGNQAGLTGLGGAISIRGNATTTINSSTLSGNTASAVSGGAIAMIAGSLTVNASTLSGNSAFNGGAIYAKGSANSILVVSNSTLSGNTAINDGGAILVGNFTTNAVTIRNSTLTLNDAQAGLIGGGGVAIQGSTGVVTIASSIIAQNTAGGDAKDVGADVATTITGKNNVIGVGDKGNITYDPTNQTGTSVTPLDAKLAALALNGAPAGSPLTHAITNTSPAFNQGNNDAALATDQRGVGFARTSGGGTDTGAFELQFATPPQVVSISYNGGNAQRSLVTSVKVTFSDAVTLGGGAFVFERIGKGSAGTIGLTINQAGSDVTLTFNNTGSITLDPGSSLPDGQYQLTIVASNVSVGALTLDGNKNGTSQGSPTDDVTSKVHRLFGDSNGDGAVGAADFAQFRSFFGLSGPSIFDYNNDNNTGAADFAQFRARFGLGGFTP